MLDDEWPCWANAFSNYASLTMAFKSARLALPALTIEEVDAAARMQAVVK